MEEKVIDNKRVLFISSYSPSFESFFNQVEGLKSVLDENKVTLDIEFMDSKQFYTEENLNNFYKSISYKIDNSEKYDVIIAGDDNALTFIVDHEELFQDQAIVFLGINDIEKVKALSLNSNIVGISESVSLKGTIEIAQILRPNAKKVIVLADATITSQVVLEIYHKLDDFDEKLNLEEIDLSEMTYAELQTELVKIDPNDIVLLVAVHKDITGKTVSFHEGVDIILGSLNQPVFCLYDFGLGEGLIGGEVVSFFEQGQVAAELVVDILQGKTINSARIIENTNKKILDYSLIKKYNLDIDGLPKDVLYINKEESFLKKIFPYLVVVIVLIILQSLLIFYLINNIRFRKLAEEELIINKKDLVDTNKRIEQIAFYDHLTQLPNRYYLIKLHSNSKKLVHENWFLAYIDISNLRTVNDLLGVQMGNRLIIGIGESLQLAVMNEPLFEVYHFGGGQFALYGEVDYNKTYIENFISELVANFEEPYYFDSNIISIIIKIGVSFAEAKRDTIETLVQGAEIALHQLKTIDIEQYCFYSEQMIIDLHEEADFEDDLKNAISNNEFFLVYQPKLNLKTNECTKFEALIRWNSPVRGFISPLDFIEIAEKTGIIIALGEWVLNQACLFVKRVQEETGEFITVAVNVSPLQVLKEDFVKNVLTTLINYGLRPNNIELEITESVFIKDISTSVERLRQLSVLGVDIAVDDFGKGYSSLAYLKNLPITVLKIDKMFIDDIIKPKDSVVNHIIDIGHHLNLKIVAEGVETKEQIDYLRASDCDYIQGYYYKKPLSEEETLQFIKSNKS